MFISLCFFRSSPDTTSQRGKVSEGWRLPRYRGRIAVLLVRWRLRRAGLIAEAAQSIGTLDPVPKKRVVPLFDQAAAARRSRAASEGQERDLAKNENFHISGSSRVCFLERALVCARPCSLYYSPDPGLPQQRRRRQPRQRTGVHAARSARAADGVQRLIKYY